MVKKKNLFFIYLYIVYFNIYIYIYNINILNIILYTYNHFLVLGEIENIIIFYGILIL